MKFSIRGGQASGIWASPTQKSETLITSYIIELSNVYLVLYRYASNVIVSSKLRTVSWGCCGRFRVLLFRHKPGGTDEKYSGSTDGTGRDSMRTPLPPKLVTLLSAWEKQFGD
jgi:hypothetical protein